MKLHIDDRLFIETNEPIDISLPLSASIDNPRAWYVDPPTFEPVRTEHYTGSVEEGGSVNFRDVYFNPHGHGTHTECLGHITREVHSVNKALSSYFFKAQLISVEPVERAHPDGELDRVILPEQLNLSEGIEALVIRTLPNDAEKMKRNYSSSNPAYLDVECVKEILSKGIKHLLIDLPSVDRENDEGKLAFHHAFWEVPSNPNFERTITELVFVEDEVEDGEYILSLQVAPFENDAAPSRPVLYNIQEK